MKKIEPVNLYSNNKTANLPEWDLSDLYPGPKSKVLKEDLKRLMVNAEKFKKKYQTNIAEISGTKLAHCIIEFENIDEKIGRIMSYAQLIYATDMSNSNNGQFYQSMQEAVTEISSKLLFFTLEINRIDDAELDKKLESPELSHFQPWIRDIRIFRPHQLSDELEEILLEKSVTGRSAWVRLFDETMANLRFRIDDQELTIAETLDRLSHKNSDKRKDAALTLGAELNNNIKLYSLITNSLAKDKEIEDKWRCYAKPVSSRNRVNQVEDDVVEALVTTVTNSYEKLSHRYYKLKAEWFGVEQLNYWDRNAPLPNDDDTIIEWKDAKRIVLESYDSFSPTLASIGAEFFDKNWIDAQPRAGKASGAFAHPTVPSAHPYLLLNYQGKSRDVMTLAHELGHGVHQVLASQQGHLMADTPLTLAETASVFGEMLTFQTLLKSKSSPQERNIMLASKVEDMLNTVVRQIAFHEFETIVHDQRRQGELTPEAIGDVWMSVQERSLGPAIKLERNYASFWSYIPHFIHSPFYVYAYAFGDCLVNSLYAVYEESNEGFAENYIEMLRAGGTLRHKELLKPFNLNASDSAFWAKGLSMVENFIDQLDDGK
jgi:oligoendopeptidase F